MSTFYSITNEEMTVNQRIDDQMKILNCPECGLKIPDALEECPKCRTKIESSTDEVKKEAQAVETQKKAEETTPVKHNKDRQKPKKGRKRKSEAATLVETKAAADADQVENVKEEMIKAVVTAEEKTATNEIAKDEVATLDEDVIAAVVEAEVLAAMKEEEATVIDEDVIAAVVEAEALAVMKEEAEKEHVIKNSQNAQIPSVTQMDQVLDHGLAAIGYLVFFLPILLGSHRKSKFIKYHAKQAVVLFIVSTVLFLGLVVLRNWLDDLFTASLTSNLNEGFTLTDISWRHGSGVLFHYYLTWMIYALHFVPFALMVTGFINAIQGKKSPLPFIGKLLKED